MRRATRCRSRAPTAAVAAGAAVVFACLAVAFHATTGWWSDDSVMRFVQLQSLVEQRFQTASVPYPASDIDPEGRFFPAGPWFHVRRGGDDYYTFLPYFPALVAPLYLLLGRLGLVVVPWVAGVASVAFIHRWLARVVPRGASWGAAMVALASPLPLYAAVFWDHTVVVAAAAGALGALCEAITAGDARASRLVAAGAGLGLGLWFRNEMYLMAAAAVAAWMLVAPRARLRGALWMAVGLSVVAVPLWVLNWEIFGHPLGWKGRSLVYGRAADIGGALAGGMGAWIAEKVRIAYFLLVASDAWRWGMGAVLAGFLVSAMVIVGGIAVRAGAARNHPALIVGGGLVVAAAALVVVARGGVVTGLVPAMPLVVLVGLPSRRWSRWERFLGVVGCVFVVAVVATGTDGGYQWGPRYLLPLLPILAWLGAGAVDRVGVDNVRLQPAVRSVCVMVLAAGLAVQLSGVRHVRDLMLRGVRVREAVRATPAAVVVVEDEVLVHRLSELFFEKRLMHVRDRPELRALVDRLAARQVDRWMHVQRAGQQFDAAVVERWTAAQPWRFRAVDDRTVDIARMVVYAGHPAGPRGDSP